MLHLPPYLTIRWYFRVEWFKHRAKTTELSKLTQVPSPPQSNSQQFELSTFALSLSCSTYLAPQPFPLPTECPGPLSGSVVYYLFKNTLNNAFETKDEVPTFRVPYYFGGECCICWSSTTSGSYVEIDTISHFSLFEFILTFYLPASGLGPWISVDGNGHGHTITPILSTVSGVATTLYAEPTPMTITTTNGGGTPGTSTYEGPVPTATNGAGGAFSPCFHPNGPGAPFCEPADGDTLYTGETSYGMIRIVLAIHHY